MPKHIATFHFLTQDLLTITHEEQAKRALEAGARWIQFRTKQEDRENILASAKAIRKLTERYKAVMIVNDYVEIARRANADGVHLGNFDQSVTEARKILGSQAIVGFSTHSTEELLDAKPFEIDYFGLGPFRQTFTKEKLDPVLGLSRITSIIRNARSKGIFKPIIAIGGIQVLDVNSLLNAGADGIAVSSAVNTSRAPAATVRDFMRYFKSAGSLA